MEVEWFKQRQSLRCATAQRPCLIQVDTSLFINCYGLLQVGVLLQPCCNLGHATVALGAQITAIDAHQLLFNTCA
jgi:hypothetical protein